MASTADQGGSDATPDGELEVEAADLHIQLEIEARRRERWIRHRLSEEATLGGVLSAAIDEEVAVQLLTGDRASGRLVAVGSDVIELRRRHARTWVATAAVAALEVGARLAAAGPPTSKVSMLGVLGDLVEHRTEVLLTLAGGTSIHGEMLAVGDIATVGTGPGDRTAYVPVAAIVTINLVT